MRNEERRGAKNFIGKSHVVVALSGQANGNSKLQLDAAPMEQQRSCRPGHLVSRQYAMFWLLWLLLCGGFAIRHTTRLLDAAGQQHYLLVPPSPGGTSPAAVKEQLLEHQQQYSVSSDLTQQRGSPALTALNHTAASGLAAAQHASWPDGYVAICAVVKDQWPDLRYWIEYHRWLGVSKFYIYDNNSTLPSMLVLWDYMQQGIVEYEYFLGRPRSRPDFTDTNQYRAYQGCLLQHFRQHRWIAFIDADEFFVFPQHHSNSSHANSNSSTTRNSHSSSQGGSLAAVRDQGANFDQQLPQRQQLSPGNQSSTVTAQGTAPLGPAATPVDGSSPPALQAPTNNTQLQHPNLAAFLSGFEGQAAVGINWVLFGSSGHEVRPEEGPLAAYTACIPSSHWESTHVKVIANTGGVLGMGGTPHEIVPRPRRSIVDVDQTPFKGPKTPQAKWHKLVLHHYVLKSRAEFVAKKARGSGAGNKKDWGYWQYVEQLANQTCTDGLAASQAFLQSKPQVALPRAARVLHGCHDKAAAAYEALLQPQGATDAEQPPTGKERVSKLDDDMLPC